MLELIFSSFVSLSSFLHLIVLLYFHSELQKNSTCFLVETSLPQFLSKWTSCLDCNYCYYYHYYADDHDYDLAGVVLYFILLMDYWFVTLISIDAFHSLCNNALLCFYHRDLRSVEVMAGTITFTCILTSCEVL